MYVSTFTRMALVLVIGLYSFVRVIANGGPFVIKYPEGDPAAKGVLARLDPDLKPAREERLRVVKEDLQITFLDKGGILADGDTPLTQVSAAYTIENPTAEDITIDFGFPIIRGIYMSPYSMMPRPDVTVVMNEKALPTQIISSSLIYAIIRQRARYHRPLHCRQEGTGRRR